MNVGYAEALGNLEARRIQEECPDDDKRDKDAPTQMAHTVPGPTSQEAQSQDAVLKEVAKTKQGGKVVGKVAPATKKSSKEGAETDGDTQMGQADEDMEL